MKIIDYNPNEPNQIGIIRNEPNDVYHKNDAISSSQLGLFLGNPQKFRALRSKEIEREVKECWKLGDASHVLIMEPQNFEARLVLSSTLPKKLSTEQEAALDKFAGLEKPSKAQIAAHEKNSATHQIHRAMDLSGRQSIKDSDYEKAKGICASVFSDSDVAPIIAGFDNFEKELTFRTPMIEKFGYALQCKLDLFNPANGSAPDIKTVRDLDVFASNLAKFGYYRQEAFYRMVVGHMGRNDDCGCEGIDIKDFPFIAVESSAPYEVGVFRSDDDDMRRGMAEIQAGLASLSRAISSGVFPKRYPGIQTIKIKPWAEKDSDRMIERQSEGGEG